MLRLVLKKVLQSSAIFISCILIICISACNGGKVSTETQRTNLVENSDRIGEINTSNLAGGVTGVSALVAVVNTL
ncbi:MAG: hypothetical protein ACYC2U_02740 [Candidatus Amoebophilus sp.]